MAVQQQDGNPYGAFNFQVTVDRIGGGDPKSIVAGFQEISGLGIEVDDAEYRNGNEKDNHVRKMNGLYKSSDVTLKRGLIGTTDFFAWVDLTRTRQPEVAQPRDHRAHGRSAHPGGDDLEAQRRATHEIHGATLNAKTGTDVAIEELVLAIEQLDIQ